MAAKGIKTSQPKLAKALRSENVIFEPKMDGTRILLTKQGSKLTFVNRRGVIKNDTYPELNDINKSIRGNVILDGEVVVLDKEHPFGNFEKLVMRDRLKDKEEIEKRSKTLPLTYVVFDILEKDRQKVADLPLSERKKILDNVIAQGKNIREIEFSNKSKELLAKVKQAKGEGIVQKDINSKYASGNTRSWEKYKLLKTNDVVVMDYVEGKGKRKGTFGALKIFVKTPKGYGSVGKVGSGFSDKDLIDIRKRLDCGEKIVGRIEYRSVGSRGNYIEPRWVGERQDILPEQTHG